MPDPDTETDPSQTIARLLSDGPVLVLTPHPDDEVFGCGALLWHAFARHGAQVVCMAEAAHAGRHGGHPAARRGELELAIAHLGGRPHDITSLRLAPGWAGQRDTFRMIATHVGAVARAIGARRIFATAQTSDNEDHRAVAEIAGIAAGMFDLDLWHYPVWATWPDDHGARGTLYRLPVGRAAAAKARALAAFRSRFVTRAHPECALPELLPKAYRDRFLKGDEMFYQPLGATVQPDEMA
ncbi:PIG-L deacetylase family protein [Roseivivax isoporae]|uniref:GlcNAc-PI de-N-acetylase n=1 Tax=Roseivivax isoporae LMG 25204 TaxID=1449351 RepID=X7FA33_9RHOB|nr:PIG-L family deacetylase [Roseivivax isoporae]ETX28949.1 hypothetical protein RISW2_04340 [Roseivivax isoporae LMG 25204]